jgi:hypothetical protein
MSQPRSTDKTSPGVLVDAISNLQRRLGTTSGSRTSAAAWVSCYLSPQQEAALASCMRASTAGYSTIDNNCGNPVQQCLNAEGAGLGNSVLPSSILENLRSSSNSNGNVSYLSPRPPVASGVDCYGDERDAENDLGCCGCARNLCAGLGIDRPAHQHDCQGAGESVRQVYGWTSHPSPEAVRNNACGGM